MKDGGSEKWKFLFDKHLVSNETVLLKNEQHFSYNYRYVESEFCSAPCQKILSSHSLSVAFPTAIALNLDINSSN